MKSRDAKTPSILVTGAAGFIGFHLIQRLLSEGATVHGVDNINSYYSTDLKLARLEQLHENSSFTFDEVDIADTALLKKSFESSNPRTVVHLAAQAGVRHSIENPFAYAHSNLLGFLSTLECCRDGRIDHLIYASSSSVYGANTKVPFATSDVTDTPVSLYAATKKSNELMAYAYSHLYGFRTTGLRFFTVYGPWGRPDMAYYSFTKAIFEGRPIDVYNQGKMKRDFTYIDDVAEAVTRMALKPAPERTTEAGQLGARSEVYNVGNHNPVELGHFIEVLESKIGKKATIIYREMQPGDVVSTFADCSDLSSAYQFSPNTTIDLGLERFVEWFRHYHRGIAG